MSGDPRDVLEILRYQLNFLEQGGYAEQAARGLLSSPFQDTLACINYGDPLRPHACRECFLFQLVPEGARTEDVPCHHIPLDQAGHTVSDYLQKRDIPGLEAALKSWLRRSIVELEVKNTGKVETH